MQADEVPHKIAPVFLKIQKQVAPEQVLPSKPGAVCPVTVKAPLSMSRMGKR
jgi:hypothetical protein